MMNTSRMIGSCGRGVAVRGTPDDRRRGLSLLEVMLAIAILGGALVAIGELIRNGSRSAIEARDTTTAQMMAESKLSELSAGILLPQPITSQPDDLNPEWLWSMAVEPAETEGLLRVGITVQKIADDSGKSPSYTLVRWMIDPGIELIEPVDQPPAEETDSSGGTGDPMNPMGAQDPNQAGAGGLGGPAMGGPGMGVPGFGGPGGSGGGPGGPGGGPGGPGGGRGGRGGPNAGPGGGPGGPGGPGGGPRGGPGGGPGGGQRGGPGIGPGGPGGGRGGRGGQNGPPGGNQGAGRQGRGGPGGNGQGNNGGRQGNFGPGGGRGNNGGGNPGGGGGRGGGQFNPGGGGRGLGGGGVGPGGGGLGRGGGQAIGPGGNGRGFGFGAGS